MREFCLHSQLLVNSKTPRAPENHLKGHWLPPFLFHSLLTCFRVAACPWNDNSSIVRKFCLHSQLLVNSKTPRAPKNHLKGHWLPPFLFHSLLTWLRVATCHWNDNPSIVRKLCLHSQLLVNSKTPRAPKKHLKGHWLPPFLFHSLLTWLRVATCHWNDNPAIVRKFCLHSQLLVNSKTPRAPKNHIKGHWLPPFLFHSLFTWLRVATWDCHFNDMLQLSTM